MKKRLLTIAAALLIAFEPAFSEASNVSYDLEKIVELALRENTTIKRNGIELGALRRKSDKRWASLVPSISVGASASRTDESTEIVGTANVSSSITLSSGTFSGIGQARLDYEAGAMTSAATAREVELAVRKAFFQILYEQEYVGYLKRTVDTAKRQYELTMKNQQAGLIPIIDTLSAKVNYRNATLALASAESSCRNDLSALKQSAGIPQSENATLLGSLEESLPKSALVAEGLSPSSPGRAVLEKKLEIARFAKRMASWGVWAPTLSCTVGTKNILQPTNVNVQPFAPNLTASISIPLGDLLPWSAANESVLAADDSIRDIELQLSAMSISDDAKFDALIQDIHAAETTIDARRLTVSLAEENYRLMEEAFAAGSKDFLALKNAADALQEAKAGLMKESYGLISSIMDLEYVCGIPYGSLLGEK